MGTSEALLNAFGRDDSKSMETASECCSLKEGMTAPKYRARRRLIVDVREGTARGTWKGVD